MTEDKPRKDESGLDLNLGSYEDAQEWIGRSSEPFTAEFPVNTQMIRYYCSAVEDPNASYWDSEFAEAHWDGIVAPPGMLQTWTLPLQWRPDGRRSMPVMAARVPLPGDKPINVVTDFEFFEPVRVGDILTLVDTLIDISPEKTTRIGTGHFITTQAEYRNQHETLLARSTSTLFRYISKD